LKLFKRAPRGGGGSIKCIQKKKGGVCPSPIKAEGFSVEGEVTGFWKKKVCRGNDLQKKRHSKELRELADRHTEKGGAGRENGSAEENFARGVFGQKNGTRGGKEASPQYPLRIRVDRHGRIQDAC